LLELGDSGPGFKRVCSEFLGAVETDSLGGQFQYYYPEDTGFRASPTNGCFDWREISFGSVNTYYYKFREIEKRGDPSADVVLNRENLKIRYVFSYNIEGLPDKKWFGRCEVSSKERTAKIRDAYAEFREVFLENRRIALEKFAQKSRAKNKL
jgi:hypothetical protein